jgi:diguanylate cyclase (GGDEF)-like protein
MKIERPRPSGPVRPASPAARPAAANAQAPAPAQPARGVADEILVLGIPEAEQTPRVKAAIARLIEEVVALRRELDFAKRRLDELEALADEDPLVAVLNRRAFVRELTRAKGILERYGTKACLMYIDLNNFREINDVHGHAGGDAALRQVAELIRNSVRGTDIIGRLGGDEFGVILTRAARAQAQLRAEAIARAIESKPCEHQGKKFKLSIAYGVYEIASGGDVEAALAGADKAMYEHKRGKADADPQSQKR